MQFYLEELLHFGTTKPVRFSAVKVAKNKCDKYTEDISMLAFFTKENKSFSYFFGAEFWKPTVLFYKPVD